jgi:hypothetical protein
MFGLEIRQLFWPCVDARTETAYTEAIMGIKKSLLATAYIRQYSTSYSVTDAIHKIGHLTGAPDISQKSSLHLIFGLLLTLSRFSV